MQIEEDEGLESDFMLGAGLLDRNKQIEYKKEDVGDGIADQKVSMLEKGSGIQRIWLWKLAAIFSREKQDVRVLMEENLLETFLLGAFVDVKATSDSTEIKVVTSTCTSWLSGIPDVNH
eukprot:7332302-Ditylum_brightwellii.AAC.2